MIRVLHYTTHNEDCGIADYQEQFIKEMKSDGSIYSEIFEYSPNVTKLMTDLEFTKVLDALMEKMKNFDILHIQHELSFFKNNELDRAINAVKEDGKKVVITIHTALSLGYETPKRIGVGPRALLSYWRKTKIFKQFESTHLLGIRKADLIVVHNQFTKKSLVDHGVSISKIEIIRHPVPIVDVSVESQEITNKLRKKDNDIIYCTVGFLSESKGIDDAIKALAFLPKNYKLALIGGSHRFGDDRYFNDICDLILKYKLEDRTYITGFIPETNRLNALVRECDICVFPFRKQYYDGVSSGSINIAIANHKASIAYPTSSIMEMNKETSPVKLVSSFNYYELAREINNINILEQEKNAEEYAKLFQWDSQAKKLVAYYRKLVKSN